MMPTASDAFALLAACTLKALILLALTFAAARVLRNRAAALRHLAWASTLAALLVLPLLSVVAPPVRVALPTASLSSPPVLPNSVSTGLLSPASTSSATDPDIAPPPTTVSVRATSIPAGSRKPLPWRGALVMLWALGVAAVLARLAVHLVRLRLVARRAQVVSEAGWMRLLDWVRAEMGIGRHVRLLRGGGVGVPVTWGTIRPAVLLPDGCDAWTVERRRAVLAHELAHVRRLDALTLWTARLATALYWFLPPAWAAARRLADEGERACDDAVLRAGTLPSAYAAHLLEIARGAGARTTAAAALAMAGSRVERRLVAILDPRQRRAGVGTRSWAGVLLAAVGVSVPVAGLRAAPAVESSRPILGISTRGQSADRRGLARVREAAVRELGLRGDVKAPREAAPPSGAGAPARADTIPRPAPAVRPALPADSAVTFSTGHSDGPGWASTIAGEHVVLAADGRDIAALQPGGWVQLNESGPGRSRTLVALPGVDGRPEYVYRVNGVPAAMGPEARAWLARELPAARP
jgi:beta-lactamase regulating signal transducer with metallopeptidase domain